MLRTKVSFWYNVSMALLLAGIAADLVFGIDAVLHAVSLIFAVGFGLAVLALVGSGIVACAWIVVRDIIDETRLDRQNGAPWRWRILGYCGLAGILVDGVVGAWNAYQEHILFSAAVKEIPFAGVPVYLALASYPLRWIEQYLMRMQRRRDDRHSGSRAR